MCREDDSSLPSWDMHPRALREKRESSLESKDGPPLMVLHSLQRTSTDPTRLLVSPFYLPFELEDPGSYYGYPLLPPSRLGGKTGDGRGKSKGSTKPHVCVSSLSSRRSSRSWVSTRVWTFPRLDVLPTSHHLKVGPVSALHPRLCRSIPPFPYSKTLMGRTQT